MEIENKVQALRAAIDIIESYKQTIKKELKLAVVDKTISLEERWDLFIDSKLGSHSSYYHEPDGLNWGNISLYDDFYYERYQTIKVDEWLDRLHDKVNDDEDEEGDDKFTFDEVAFKEYFLKNFIYSFDNDW